MTSQSPRIYLYKITFEEVPYYYYGVHKEKVFDEDYWGTPVTNKWCWELYIPKKQILELFEFSDEGWLEAKLIEDRLIKPFFNADKWCLNENCGGIMSLDILRENGRKMHELKMGVHARTKEEMIYQGIKNYEQKLGIHSLSLEERIENGKKGGSISGKISGKAHKENKTGVFARSKEKMSEDGRRGGQKSKELCLGIHALTIEHRSENGKKGGSVSAKITNSQKWECCETGYVSTAAGVVSYQKGKGISTSKNNRRRIE